VADHTGIDLSVLTPRQRLVVVLHYYCDWTYVDIAEAVGSAESSVRTHAQRALSRLKVNVTR